MKGLDTNVLVRYLTQDHPGQARDALIAEALSEGERLHVDDVVLCELVWVLRGAYRTGKPAIVSALEKISSTSIFSFTDREVLRQSVADYRDGGGDFARPSPHSEFVVSLGVSRVKRSSTLGPRLRGGDVSTSGLGRDFG